MRVQKRRFRYKNWTPVQHPQPQTFSSLAATVVARGAKARRQSVYSTDELLESQCVGKRTGGKLQRRELRKWTGLCGGLSGVVSGGGWTLFLCGQKGEKTREWELVILTIIWVISLLQCGLIIAYWQEVLKYSEQQRHAFKSLKPSVKSLSQNPAALLQCTCECVLHLIVPIPTQPVSENPLYGLLLLLRTYHCFRYIYWNLAVSSPRTTCYLEVFRCSLRQRFTVKWLLGRFGLGFILGLYGLLLMLFGLAQWTSNHERLVLWDQFWLVAVAQTTVGYGDLKPVSTLNQFGLFLGCFSGIFVLGIVNFLSQHAAELTTNELSLYAHIAGHRTKQCFKQVSFVLIQRWWRLLMARRHRLSAKDLVLPFYAQLTAHHAEVLRARHTTECMKLDKQLKRADHAICTKLEKTLHYLHPIPYFRELVLATQATDLSRKQYSIELQTDRILRICKSRTVSCFSAPRPKRKIRIQLSAVPELSIDSRESSVVARASAYLSVFGRVGRAWSSRSSTPSFEELQVS